MSTSDNNQGRQRSRRRRPPSGVLVRGVVYGGSGYADETRGIVLGLQRAGIPIQLEPVEFYFDLQNLLSHSEREELEIAKHRQVDLAHGVLFQNFPAHDFALSMYAHKRVGRTMYETDAIPDGWAQMCEAMDEVWVPSTFNCASFARGGVSPERLRAMPEGVNTDLFRPGLEPLPIAGKRGFNFLSVFEWIQRKGPDILIRAFVSEFGPREDVALILKAYGRPDPSVDLLPRILYLVERQMGIRIEDAPTILVLAPGFLRTEDVPRLYASADAFVLPTRGEGWGRPYMEALACECPVIATKWSGQMDFLHDGICEFIEYDLAEIPWNIDVELSAGHRTAEPHIAVLQQAMRRAFENRLATKAKAVKGRVEMVEKWDWDVVIRDHWVPQFDRLLA